MSELPEQFGSPFGNDVHPLAVLASHQLQKILDSNSDLTQYFDKNKCGNMFGVLVIKDMCGRVGFLSAFSGDLSNEIETAVFVPPIATYVECAGVDGSILFNILGEEKKISSFFQATISFKGVGECVAPKLLQYAIKNNLVPLALAEFWWGESPADEVRHHGYFYPACRRKCGPILPFLLKGVDVQLLDTLGENFEDNTAPETVYEDNHLLVVVKPAGLLSVPGKNVKDSVLTRLQARYPDATGPLLLHRLDLSTSGLLLAAKNAKTHKALQRQFIDRTIQKRYVAILSKRLSISSGVMEGTIDLPLRVDIEDRPRQLVCYSHGKVAVTRWEIIERGVDTTRVYFYPVTGRTHQLRIHASHKYGLNAPIVGDPLYGKIADRLLLHAEFLCFTHPATGKRIEIVSPPPF
ncbi:MAG: RluA family pseudouridine synthase [Gammaproteobacteria bacterium]|nr:RluA family pseudouridine synthase [Gammaproteobacteria bacterium]